MVSARLSPAQRLERDSAEVRARYRILREHTRGATDPLRLLVVISITHGAERHLPRSLPRLFAQTRARGCAVDLLLGCNNGYQSRELDAWLEKHSGCRVIEGFCSKLAADRPAAIVDRGGAPLLISATHPDEDRCFLIRQRPAPQARSGVAAGKIRMLGDLYGLIADSIAAGWHPPRLLLACDAESEFELAAPWSLEQAGEPGLARLLERFANEADLDLLGTRNRFAAFETLPDGSRQPRLDWRLPSMQLYLNLVHSRAHGFMWMPGGGTLGRTEALTALLAVICSHYPSMRIEDTQTTLLGRSAGFGVAIDTRVCSLNRCASPAEKDLAIGQLERYISGQKDLEEKYGREVGRIVPGSTFTIIAAGVKMALVEIFSALAAGGGRRLAGTLLNTAHIIGALPTHIRIKLRAPKDRSDDPDFSASW